MNAYPNEIDEKGVSHRHATRALPASYPLPIYSTTATGEIWQGGQSLKYAQGAVHPLYQKHTMMLPHGNNAQNRYTHSWNKNPQQTPVSTHGSFHSFACEGNHIVEPYNHFCPPGRVGAPHEILQNSQVSFNNTIRNSTTGGVFPVHYNPMAAVNSIGGHYPQMQFESPSLEQNAINTLRDTHIPLMNTETMPEGGETMQHVPVRRYMHLPAEIGKLTNNGDINGNGMHRPYNSPAAIGYGPDGQNLQSIVTVGDGGVVVGNLPNLEDGVHSARRQNEDGESIRDGNSGPPNVSKIPLPSFKVLETLEDSIVSAIEYLFHPNILSNHAIKSSFCDDLWVSISVLLHHEPFSALGLKPRSGYFVATILKERAFQCADVDTKALRVRPRWAMTSSLLMCNINPYSTSEEVLGILDRGYVDDGSGQFQIAVRSVQQCSYTTWAIYFDTPSGAIRAAWKLFNGRVFDSANPIEYYVSVGLRPDTKMYRNSPFSVIEMDPFVYGPRFMVPPLLVHFFESHPGWDVLAKKTSEMAKNAYCLYHSCVIHLPGRERCRFTNGRVSQEEDKADSGLADENHKLMPEIMVQAGVRKQSGASSGIVKIDSEEDVSVATQEHRNAQLRRSLTVSQKHSMTAAKRTNHTYAEACLGGAKLSEPAFLKSAKTRSGEEIEDKVRNSTFATKPSRRSGLQDSAGTAGTSRGRKRSSRKSQALQRIRTQDSHCLKGKISTASKGSGVVNSGVQTEVLHGSAHHNTQEQITPRRRRRQTEGGFIHIRQESQISPPNHEKNKKANGFEFLNSGPSITFSDHQSVPKQPYNERRNSGGCPNQTHSGVYEKTTPEAMGGSPRQTRGGK